MIKKSLYTVAALWFIAALAILQGIGWGADGNQVHATDHISKEEAGEIVTDKYGGNVLNVEEESDGAIYEVEVEDSDEGRIEVDVDAAVGVDNDKRILKIEYDDDNKEDESFIISEEDAEKTATDEYGGEVKETQIEHEDDSDGNNVLVYEVELRGSDEGDIEVDVDARSGELFDSEKEDGDGDDEEDSRISKEEAGGIVTDKYGGDVINVEEKDDGDVYKVEVEGSKKDRIKVDVDAYSGDILEVEEDNEDGDQAGDDEENDDPISKEEAGKIVTDKYGGDIINVEEEESGDVYEVEVKDSDKGRIEVDVDAYSGEILNIEQANDDNDNGDDNQDLTGVMNNHHDGGTSGSDQEGGKLPNTASNAPLGMLGGSLMVLSGGVLWFINRRRRKHHHVS